MVKNFKVDLSDYLFVKPLHDKIGTSLDKDANE